MWRAILVSLFVLGALQSSFAGGRGGHNTTFDPNLYGGPTNVSCITSSIAGKCNTGYGATCNGTDSDATAWASWVSASIAANPTKAVLYIPPGSNCILDTTGTHFCITSDCSAHNLSGITNADIWMYGATIQNVQFVGGFGFFDNNTNNALINTASAGDSTVTVNDGNIGRFSVGRWITITALGLQLNGFPPNFQFFEFRLITAINGSVITLSSILGNSYKSTYPQLSTGGPSSINLGGPAMIYLLEPSWNTNVTIRGGTIYSAGQVTFQGRTIVAQDVSISGVGTDPTVSQSIFFSGCELLASEIDKEIESLNITRCTGDQLTIQSASVAALNISNSNFRGALGGTVLNTNIVNTIFSPGGPNNGIRAGSTCCGRSNSISLDGVTFPTALTNFHHIDLSSLSFAAGTFTISKSDINYTNGISVGLFVPGYKYFLGDVGGVNNCSSANTFTVSDVQDAGANVNVVTDLINIPITNICNSNSRPPSTIGAYQAMSLTQKFSGPANLLSNPEMLPP